MNRLIGNSIIDPPFYYTVGELITIKFRTDRDVLQQVLPPILKVPEGPAFAAVTFVRQIRSTFGPYVGVYLGGFAELDSQPVLHGLSGMKTNFRGSIAGENVWGMPLQPGDASMNWNDGDVMRMVAGRGGVNFVHASLCLERRTDAPTEIWKQTFASRQRLFQPGDGRNILCTIDIDRSSTEVEHWTATSLLNLVGGDPRDDWSMFPVHEVVETRYSAGGNVVLKGANVLARW